MVMLDLLGDGATVVAHVDHGIRENSGEDYDFVERAAQERGLEFRGRRLKLGAGASEELARRERYKFLREVQAEFQEAEESRVEVLTAHHLDDVVETVAINLVRGTGWRGLAVFENEDVKRPFLEMGWGRKEVLKYAAEKKVAFRQDQSNTEGDYLRNRLREQLRNLPEGTKEKLLELWRRQTRLRREIEAELEILTPARGEIWQREWFKGLDEVVAMELLRCGLQKMGASATRPQIENFRQAILEYAPGKSFNLPEDRLVRLEKDSFYLS